MLGAYKSRLGPNPNLVLHVGAGDGTDLPDYLAAGFKHIYLVEPNPEREDALTEAVADHDQAHLIAAALTGEDLARRARVDLNVLNHADLSSIRTPDGLLRLLPGIKVKSTPQVKALSIRSLFADLPKLTRSQENWLVLETPGTELAILKAMIKAKVLTHFEFVTLRCDAETYFVGGNTAGDVLKLMQAQSYQLMGQSDDDPDWPVFWFVRDKNALKKAADDAALKKLEKTHARTQATARTLKKELSAARAALAEAEAALDTQRTEAEARHAADQTTLENLRTQLEDELNKARAEVAEAEARQESDRDAADSSRATLEEELSKTKAELANLKATRAEDMRMGLHLQNMSLLDKTELQDRYAKLQEQHALQSDLLRKLTQKLGSAATFLKQMPRLDAPLDPQMDTYPPAREDDPE